MATKNVTVGAHATLSGTTVDTVNITREVNTLCVLNRSGVTDLAVTVSTAATPSAATPVQDADDTFKIPAGVSLTFNVGAAGYDQTQLKILGNGNSYTVEVLA